MTTPSHGREPDERESPGLESPGRESRGHAAFRHYLEHAADVHGERFAEWFPETFDWPALAADAPAMAERLGSPPFDRSGERRIELAADAAFRAAHLATLAVLCAVAEGDQDPEALLDRITRPPDDEEEEEFTRLAAEALAEVERALADDPEEAEGGEGGREAIALLRVAWPPVLEHLGEAVTEAGEDEAQAHVLLGVARVGAILAAFRWMAAAKENDDWPAVQDAGGDPLG